MIRTTPVSLETRDTGCMRDATSVTALAEVHAQCALKKKETGSTQAPSDRTSNDMWGCHVKPVMRSEYTASSFDFNDAKGKGKAKDPTIYRAEVHESNDGFDMNSEPPRTPQGYGGSNPRSHNLEAVLGSPSSATFCLHGKKAVPLPVNNINPMVVSADNTRTESATISKEKPYAKDDTLNQREATNMIYVQGRPLQFMSGSAASKLRTLEPLTEGCHSGSVCGSRDLRNRSLDLSFCTGQFETRDDFLRRQIQMPHLALPTDPSQSSLYSKTLSPTTFPPCFFQISSTDLSFEEVVDSLLMAGSMQTTPSNPLHGMDSDSPCGTMQRVNHMCDAISNDDRMEGNGQNFQSPTNTGQNEIDTQRDIRFRIHYELHGPRSCPASLCNHVDTLRAHVLQTWQTMERNASFTISKSYGSYDMAQQQIFASRDIGAESSKAQNPPPSTTFPSLEASNQSHDYFNSVLDELLEGLTPSSGSRHTSRKKSRQHPPTSRRPSSAPLSGGSKASSRTTQTRVHGAAAVSLLLRMLCFSHGRFSQQTVAVAPEIGSFWLHCHPISLPFDSNANNNNSNNARDSDGGDIVVGNHSYGSDMLMKVVPYTGQ